MVGNFRPCCYSFPQASFFETMAQPPEVLAALEEIVAAVPGLGPESRVLDVGAGTGALIPHLQAQGVRDIVAIDLSEGMLSRLRAQHASPSYVGNEPGVRCG